MDRFRSYLFIQSLKEIVHAFLPILIIVAVVIAGILAWRLWLRYNASSPITEARIEALERRISALEEKHKAS